MATLTSEDIARLRVAQLRMHDLVTEIHSINASPVDIARFVIRDRSLHGLRDIVFARLRYEEMQKLFEDLLDLVVAASGGPSWAEDQIIGKMTKEWVVKQLQELVPTILKYATDTRDYAAVYRLSHRVDPTLAKQLISQGLESSDYDIQEYVTERLSANTSI